VIAAAGDIGAAARRSQGPRRVPLRRRVGHAGGGQFAAVLPLGDEQYEDAPTRRTSPFSSRASRRGTTQPGPRRLVSHPIRATTSYRFADPTNPSNFNQNPTAGGYFSYFASKNVLTTAPGQPAGSGYYSFNIGTWHFIALNSNDHCTMCRVSPALRRSCG